MFEIMMLLGFVYAGCCVLLPDREHTSRHRSQQGSTQRTIFGSKRRDNSIAKVIHRRRLVTANLATASNRPSTGPAVDCRVIM